MDAFKAILEGVIGKFVCNDGGIYKGQCPQLPKYAATSAGMKWTGNTGHGKDTVNRIIEQGGYSGTSSRGYRFASCDVAGSPYGHTWVEIKQGNTWTIYEQNINRPGTKTANFGCGTVYSVSKTNNPGSWRLNTRYAGHPAVDAYIDAHTPKPEPTPAPTPQPAGFKVGDKVVPTRLVDYNGTPLYQWDPVYTITQINGDRAVLSAPRNGVMTVWAAMNTKDIKKA